MRSEHCLDTLCFCLFIHNVVHREAQNFTSSTFGLFQFSISNKSSNKDFHVMQWYRIIDHAGDASVFQVGL